MAYHPTPGFDSEPGRLAHAESATPALAAETDLEDLAARFMTSTGNGLSRELSTDLALEIVLHEIVEQACLATGATGAAIVLEREGEFVCRASSGPTAPELGARLDGHSGLSGECLRTRRVQRSADAQSDPAADAEASRWLGVRSVLVYPLLDGDRVLGIFEAFSSESAAFGERDEMTLEALAARILKNLRQAAEPTESKVEKSPTKDEVSTTWEADVDGLSEDENGVVSPRRGLDVATWAMAAVVFLCCGWFGVRIFQRVMVPHVAARRPVTSSSVPSGNSGGTPSAVISTAKAARPEGAVAVVNAASKVSPIRKETASDEGDLRVYENGKEVFRMPAGTDRNAKPSLSSGNPRSDRLMQLSQDAAEKTLLHRVEPEYPEKAREGRIQGTVIVDARIASSGDVKQVRVISGPEILAEAAVIAVRQWKFKPFPGDGEGSEMQTTITLNFRLPE